MARPDDALRDKAPPGDAGGSQVSLDVAPDDRASPACGAERPRVRATLIYNPRAGHGDALAALTAVRAELERRGWSLRLEPTSGPGAATTLAHDAVERGDDVVVVAGGDGTINEAIQALAGSATALGVVPVGTVNVWALETGLPAHPAEIAAVLADGDCRVVDLGRAGERYFLLMAGAGFDGAVTSLVETRLKRTMGRWAYVVTAVRLALRYGGAEVALEMDGGTLRCRLLLTVVGNTRLYAGRFTVTAGAIADDGLLDVVVVPGRRLWDALPLLPSMLLRRAPFAPGALYYRTRRLSIAAAEPLPVQVDGDYLGAGPLDFSVVPGALRVIVPRGMATPLFGIPASPAHAIGAAHES